MSAICIRCAEEGRTTPAVAARLSGTPTGPLCEKHVRESMIDGCPSRDSVAGAPHVFERREGSVNRVCAFCGAGEVVKRIVDLMDRQADEGLMPVSQLGMRDAAEKQAQERADRDRKTCFVWVYEGVWYVRTAEEGRPANAVLITTREPL